MFGDSHEMLINLCRGEFVLFGPTCQGTTPPCNVARELPPCMRAYDGVQCPHLDSVSHLNTYSEALVISD